MLIYAEGPNEVMIRDPAAILPLMGTSGWGKGPSTSTRIPIELSADISDKLDWAGRTLGAPVHPLIGIRDNAEHAKRRRTWNRGFNPTSMKQYEPMVHKRVSQLLEEIVQRGRVDLGEMFGYFALVSSFITQLELTLTSCR